MYDTSLSLLERVRRQNDSQSWNRFVDLYRSLLLNWLAKYNLQDSDRDDLVQEVLAVLVRELPAFQHTQQVGAFRCWLRTTLVNRLRDFWRTQQRRAIATGDADFNLYLDSLADDQSEASRVWDQQHDEFIVARVIDSVRPRIASKTWEAFRLLMFDGASAKDAAEKLGMSVDSVYAAKARVLRMLRQEAEGLVD